MAQGKHGMKGGKKLRRCRNNIINDPRQKKARCADGTYGSLHKKNGPETRPPVFSPNPMLVAYYEHRTYADDLREIRRTL